MSQYLNTRSAKLLDCHWRVWCQIVFYESSKLYTCSRLEWAHHNSSPWPLRSSWIINAAFQSRVIGGYSGKKDLYVQILQLIIKWLHFHNACRTVNSKETYPRGTVYVGCEQLGVQPVVVGYLTSFLKKNQKSSCSSDISPHPFGKALAAALISGSTISAVEWVSGIWASYSAWKTLPLCNNFFLFLGGGGVCWRWRLMKVNIVLGWSCQWGMLRSVPVRWPIETAANSEIQDLPFS